MEYISDLIIQESYLDMLDNDSLYILKRELDAFQASEIDRITGRPQYSEVKVTKCHSTINLQNSQVNHIFFFLIFMNNSSNLYLNIHFLL